MGSLDSTTHVSPKAFAGYTKYAEARTPLWICMRILSKEMGLFDSKLEMGLYEYSPGVMSKEPIHCTLNSLWE